MRLYADMKLFAIVLVSMMLVAAITTVEAVKGGGSCGK